MRKSYIRSSYPMVLDYLSQPSRGTRGVMWSSNVSPKARAEDYLSKHNSTIPTEMAITRAEIRTSTRSLSQGRVIHMAKREHNRRRQGIIIIVDVPTLCSKLRFSKTATNSAGLRKRFRKVWLGCLLSTVLGE